MSSVLEYLDGAPSSEQVLRSLRYLVPPYAIIPLADGRFQVLDTAVERHPLVTVDTEDLVVFLRIRWRAALLEHHRIEEARRTKAQQLQLFDEAGTITPETFDGLTIKVDL